MFVQWGMYPKNSANVVKLFLQCKWLIKFVQWAVPVCHYDKAIFVIIFSILFLENLIVYIARK